MNELITGLLKCHLTQMLNTTKLTLTLNDIQQLLKGKEIIIESIEIRLESFIGTVNIKERPGVITNKIVKQQMINGKK